MEYSYDMIISLNVDRHCQAPLWRFHFMVNFHVNIFHIRKKLYDDKWWQNYYLKENTNLLSRVKIFSKTEAAYKAKKNKQKKHYSWIITLKIINKINGATFAKIMF